MHHPPTLCSIAFRHQSTGLSRRAIPNKTRQLQFISSILRICEFHLTPNATGVQGCNIVSWCALAKPLRGESPSALLAAVYAQTAAFDHGILKESVLNAQGAKMVQRR
jgi:hypothetical protein